MGNQKSEGKKMPGWVKWGFIGSIVMTASIGGLTFFLFHTFMA